MKRNIGNKNKGIKNKKAGYIPVMAGMVLLVIVALFLPQLLFTLQDQYSMQRTELAERDKLNIANLNLIYEEQLSTRLKQFAEEEKHYVTAIEYDVSDDVQLSNILIATLQQNYIYMLYENGFLPEDVIVMLTLEKLSINDRREDNEYYIYVKEWKKYIFYGEELEKGVTLMAWYIDFFLLDGTEMKVLADVESGTIYYLKVTNSSSTVWSSWNDATAIKERQEALLVYYEKNLYFYNTYSTYYEANTEIFDELFPETESYNSAVYGVKVYDAEENTREEKENGFVKKEIEDNVIRLSYPLYYEKYNLIFCFEADFNCVNNSICPDITIGIPAIGELIPEMIQN